MLSFVPMISIFLIIIYISSFVSSIPMEFPHPSLMQTQLSAKGQSIERKSHAEAYGVVHRFDSPHKRRVTNFHHTAWDAIQLGQLNRQLKKEYDGIYKEFKQDKNKPEEERKYCDHCGRRMRRKRAIASKRERKQEKKVAQVINDVDYHVQHGTMTEKDRQYIHNTINRSRSPAFREKDYKNFPFPIDDKQGQEEVINRLLPAMKIHSQQNESKNQDLSHSKKTKSE